MDNNFELIKRELNIENIAKSRKEALVLKGLNRIAFYGDAEKYYLKAEELRKGGNYTEAIEYYKRSLDINDKNEKIHYGLARCYFETSQYKQSIQICEQGLKLSLNDNFYSILVLSFYELKKYKEVIKTCQKALEINPEFVTMHECLADIYCNKINDYHKAILHYNKVIESNPNRHYLYFDLGRAYYCIKEYQKALDSFLKVTKHDKENADAHYYLGFIYILQKQFSKGIEAYHKVIEINPDYRNVHYNLGWAYADIKEYYKSIESFKGAVIKEPNDADIYYGLGWIYSKLEKYENTIKMFKMAVRIRPKYIYAHYGLGLAHLVLGDRKMAIEEYDILKSLDQNIAHKLFEQIYS
jgi:tetratricopeptide (TPR) repeat protein